MKYNIKIQCNYQNIQNKNKFYKINYLKKKIKYQKLKDNLL